MKHNKLLTLSLLASLLILISASFATAANTLSYGTLNVCPMPAGSKVYVPVTVSNDVALAAMDIVGKTVSVTGGVTLVVTNVTFDTRMADGDVLDTRYPLDFAAGGEFRFGAVKIAGSDLAANNGRVALLELQFVSSCKPGSAAIDPATADFCGTSVSTAFVSAAAAQVTPTVASGAINVVNATPQITCPDNFEIQWNGGSVDVIIAATDDDLSCGCDTLTFSLAPGDIGSIHPKTGRYQYAGNRDDIGCNTVHVTVTDKFGGSASCTFKVDVLNLKPDFTGFAVGEDEIACGDTIFTTWDLDMSIFPIATDPDGGPQNLTYQIIGWTGGGDAPDIDINTGEITWNPPFDMDYWGNHTVTVVTNDGAPLDECNTVNADTCSFVIRVVGFAVSIEKVHHALQGHDAHVSVYLDSAMIGLWTYTLDFVGGYDLLLAYDASALQFMTATKGALLTEFDWEYFTYRYGPNGNCGNACPSGMVRLVAMSETNNGAHHGGTITHPGELADLTFRVTNDATFNCMYAPISFYWFDCGDNALSDMTGRFLYVGDSVFFFEGGSVPNLEDTLIYGYDGAEAICWDTILINNQPGYVKNYPLRALWFRNGGIDIECADSIDARGDINLNGVAYEIADAVMFTNYFIHGLAAFGTDMMRVEASIAASDANADGIKLSVADLVYIIRVITGDALPYAKLIPGTDMNVSTQVMNGSMTVRYTSGVNAGAALLVFDVNGTAGDPVVGDGARGMDVLSGVSGTELRVLVYNIGNSAIIAGTDNVLLTIPVDGSMTLRSIEVADFFGTTMNVSTHVLPSRYDVAQNYPNPFNPNTKIALALPVAGEYNLAIYNVAGQLVRAYSGSAPAGVTTIEWDGRDTYGSQVASGMYFYKATVGNFTATKKMILMK